MINRFSCVSDQCVSLDDGGDLVDYHDHAAEMREVLALLNEFATERVTAKLWGKYGLIAKEYAHYLEEE